MRSNSTASAKQPRCSSAPATSSSLFRRSDIVFARLRGHPWWPGRIEEAQKKKGHIRYKVKWFNDQDTTSWLWKDQVIEFPQDDEWVQKREPKDSTLRQTLRKAIELASSRNSEYCEECGVDYCDDTNKVLIFCDGCPKSYHASCVDDYVKISSSEPWFCKKCLQGKKNSPDGLVSKERAGIFSICTKMSPAEKILTEEISIDTDNLYRIDLAEKALQEFLQRNRKTRHRRKSSNEYKVERPSESFATLSYQDELRHILQALRLESYRHTIEVHVDIMAIFHSQRRLAQAASDRMSEVQYAMEDFEKIWLTKGLPPSSQRAVTFAAENQGHSSIKWVFSTQDNSAASHGGSGDTSIPEKPKVEKNDASEDCFEAGQLDDSHKAGEGSRRRKRVPKHFDDYVDVKIPRVSETENQPDSSSFRADEPALGKLALVANFLNDTERLNRAGIASDNLGFPPVKTDFDGNSDSGVVPSSAGLPFIQSRGDTVSNPSEQDAKSDAVVEKEEKINRRFQALLVRERLKIQALRDGIPQERIDDLLELATDQSSD